MTGAAMPSPIDTPVGPPSPLPGQMYEAIPADELDDYAVERAGQYTPDITDATTITSLVDMGGTATGERHKVVVDIDLPVKVIGSTTPGHHHLFIDHEITWDQYLGILRAFSEAGIVEPGFVTASEKRGYTAVRLPWVKKKPTARCVGCHLRPSSLDEYRQLAVDEGYATATEACRREEGTYNPANGHFWCNACYIAAGQPLGVAP